MDRKPVQAGSFYPGYREECVNALRMYVPESVDVPAAVAAGIVPHAGWMFSGATAGKVYRAIRQTGQPQTFVVFGAVHVPGVAKASIWSKGRWITPLGPIEIDESLAEAIVKNSDGWVEDNAEPHRLEHSIEVQIPFIQHLFPRARLVPIMVSSFPNAHKIGECLASVAGEEIAVVGSTDLTHYGTRFGFTPKGTGNEALKWAKETNDRQMIDLILDVQPEKVFEEARNNHNACGEGAIAATLGYARTIGKTKGTLLEYTTSWDVYPERKLDTFVGYAGVVF